jgi:hypothetical protein
MKKQNGIDRRLSTLATLHDTFVAQNEVHLGDVIRNRLHGSENCRDALSSGAGGLGEKTEGTEVNRKR